MKYPFIDIPEKTELALILHNAATQLRMDITLIRFLRNDIAVISLHTNVTQVLNFDKISADLIYTSDDGHPYIWKKVQIVYFKGNYILQVKGDGTRFNRRNAFRVGVSRTAQIRTLDGRIHPTIAKDVSLTGFSITDRSRELSLYPGVEATLMFEDIGHELNLRGKVIRIEEKDEYIVYGFSLVHASKDLTSYITMKQRRKRNFSPSALLGSGSDN